MITVLIVDDHAFVRFGVSMLLDNAEGITVIGECADGNEIQHLAGTLDPDVVLMDLRLPGTSGLEATRELAATHPRTRVLVHTASATGGSIDQAARAGAAGYLFKGGTAADLIAAIRIVAAGGSVWPRDRLGLSSQARQKV